MFSKAQGTIEYLIIMAVVIVIGLLVVGMASTFLDSSSGVSGGIGNLNSLAGPISISEIVVDVDGDGYSAFTNNTGETLVVTKINVGGVDNNYNKTFAPGELAVFELNELTSGCTCTTPGETKTCVTIIYYTSVNGITKSVEKSVTVECVGDASTDGDVVDSQEDVAPVISLTSAIAVDQTFTFTYSADDNSDIASCDLILNDVVDQTDSSSPFTSFTKNYLSPQYTTWDVNCTDEHGNEGTVTAENITGDGPYYLSNCLDLNAMSYRLDANYIMFSDVNCYDDTHVGGDLWNSGEGFTPVGRDSPYFEGALNGNSKIISNLFINQTDNYTGLFGIQAGQITDLALVDLNVISTGHNTGGLVGYNTDNGVISGVYVEGVMSGANYIGFLAGTNDGLIENAYSEGTLECSKQRCGGLVGHNFDFIHDSFSSVTVTAQDLIGTSAAGGLVGMSQDDTGTRALIINSFATGGVTGTGSAVGGLVGWALNTDINNSFDYNFAGNPSDCVGLISTSTVDCNSDMGLDYFKGDVYPNSQPFDDWNFFNIWEERSGNFPSLTWQGLGGDY